MATLEGLAVAKALWDWEPHSPEQLEWMLCDAKIKTGACGRRWGKSESTAIDILLYAFETPNTIQTILAPEDDNLKEITEKIELFLAAAPGLVEGRDYKLVKSPTWKLEFRDAKKLLRPTTIRARTLGKKGQGVRGRNSHRVIVDEAAFVSDAIMDAVVTPLLADFDGQLILISTPSGRNHFKRDFDRGQDPLQPRYKSFRFASGTNPHLPKAYLDNEKATKPDRVYRVEYEAEFADAEGLVFRSVEACCSGDWEEPLALHRYSAGLDLARYNDFTVLSIIDRETGRLVYQDRFNLIGWGLQVARICTALDKYNNCPVLVETNNVGDVVLEKLIEAGARATGFDTTPASKPDLIDKLAVAFETSTIHLPARALCAVAVNELMDYEYRRSPAGHVSMSAPEGKHDDCVMSIALAWRAAASPVPGAPVSSGGAALVGAGAQTDLQGKQQAPHASGNPFGNSPANSARGGLR